MNYILTDENAIYYECGYSNDNSIYLALGSDSYLITDGRYKLDALESLHKTKLIISNNLSLEVSKLINRSKIKKISFNPKEWSYSAITSIKEKTKSKWNSKPDFSHKRRIIKTSQEIKMLKKAVDLGSDAFDIFAEAIRLEGIGISEKRLNFIAERVMRKEGDRALSFEPITALNRNSAKPHAYPSEIISKKGDILLFDAGLKYKRYCSDRTRTSYLDGNITFDIEQKFNTKKRQKIYDIVRKAHDRAISKSRAGMKASQIDRFARDVIEKAGYSKYFVHSTGHGVGLDIHEMPYISTRSKTKVEDGMVFTIEPGIYIPGEFGVRIEDMVLMNDGKVEVL